MADEATSGLDALPGAKVQAAPVKGGISVPGINMLDSSATEQLLANMQDLINKRSASNPLSDTIQDMQAALVGQSQQRQAYKDQQAQELFNMRAQMAALRGSQAAQQNQQKSLDFLMGQNQPGAQGQPQAGAQQISTAIPDVVLKTMAAHKATGDYTGAQKVYDEWAKEESNAKSQAGYNAAGNTQQKYFINGQLVDLTPNEYMALPTDKKSQIQVVAC